jgi:tetrapyrrole methylase family protein/MazG family protein
MARSKKKRKKNPAPSVKRSKSTHPPALSPGAWFEKLVAVQKRLRAPDGCPWDREQTHATLRTYLLEEAYEVLDALESGNDAKFAEEMGDLLLQIVFHSEIAREEKRFDISTVIREIHDKMVRRHPHVFGGKKAKNTAEVLKNWEQIKKEERRDRAGNSSAARGAAAKAESLLDGIPKGIPAALEAYQLTRRAARIGFDWDNLGGILLKMHEESAELQEALKSKGSKEAEEELGDLLFAAANVARFLKIDPEIALKRANAKFTGRFQWMERAAEQGGRSLATVPRTEMEELWNQAKIHAGRGRSQKSRGQE